MSIILWTDKQIVVHLWNGILLSNVKKWTIDMNNKIGESQNSYAKWKKKKIIHTEWFNLYEILENEN